MASVKSKSTRILHVADEQLSFACYKYAKRLNRALEKAGYKTKVLSNGLKESPDVMRLYKPDVVHVHYHPDARKLRRAITAARELKTPCVVTYHEAERTQLERQGHVIKCLQRTQHAIFLCERDRDYGIAQNPSLKTSLIRQPSPYKLDKEWLAAKHDWLSHWLWQQPPIQILHCGIISPEAGIELLLELAERFPDGWKLVIAGMIPAGHGKYAKFLKEDAKQRNLPIEWRISKRELGRRQMVSLLEKSAFAYLPFGHIRDADYSGATMHSRMIPMCHNGYVRLFSHRGKHSDAAVEEAVELLDRPEALIRRIEHYLNTPQELMQLLEDTKNDSNELQWPAIAKQMGKIYKGLVTKET